MKVDSGDQPVRRKAAVAAVVDWAIRVTASTLLLAGCAAPGGGGAGAGAGAGGNGPKQAVGRVDVALPSPGWTAVDLAAARAGVAAHAGMVNGDGMDVSSKAFLHPGANGRLDAVLVVRTTRGFGWEVVRDPKCFHTGKGDDTMYLFDMNNQSHDRPGCVRAWDSIAAKSLDKILPDEVRQTMKSGSLALTSAVGIVEIDVMNTNGAIVDVLAVLSDGVEGKAVPAPTPAAPLPAGFPPGLAAWADALGLAAKGAANSLGGRLTVPGTNVD